VKLNHIPYKGAGPALKDLLGGVIDLAFDPGVGLPQAKAGKLRLIAIAGPKRHPDFPDVPTLEENGIKGVDGGPYFGFYTPNGTPPAVLTGSTARCRGHAGAGGGRALSHARRRRRPADDAGRLRHIRAEDARYGKLLKELGIEQ
jgi:tripartite-type tricarboxylate transporter receptor subunit TctC